MQSFLCVLASLWQIKNHLFTNRLQLIAYGNNFLPQDNEAKKKCFLAFKIFCVISDFCETYFIAFGNWFNHGVHKGLHRGHKSWLPTLIIFYHRAKKQRSIALVFKIFCVISVFCETYFIAFGNWFNHGVHKGLHRVHKVFFCVHLCYLWAIFNHRVKRGFLQSTQGFFLCSSVLSVSNI
jgi:hypothetical protein